MIRKLLDILFWLSLTLYLGGTIALGAIVAPAVFDTTKSQHINLSNIAPPLDPASQAGGEIFGVILQRFSYVEFPTLSALFLVILAWLFLERFRRPATWALALIWITVAGLAAYDALSLTPEVFAARQQLRDTAPAHAADAPGTPWPERQIFDALHQRSETRAHLKAYTLLALLLLAAWTRTANTKPQPPALDIAANPPSP